MTTFVDTNILIHLLNPDGDLHAWSIQQFESCKAMGPVVVTDIVYCEFSIGMASKEDVDIALSGLAIDRSAESDEVLFRAGRAFLRYRDENKGPKLNVLPDFLIGASAEIAGSPLLTINKKDILRYFPRVKIICPN
jgi:predicted nucleic acid-binding protein